MKAAVMYQKGEMPQYADFPLPLAQNENEKIVSVKAVAIKNLDRSQAAGKHYSAGAAKQGGRVIGGDGVCLLENGTRVYAVGVSGMLAEKATVNKKHIVPLPATLDDATAASLPNAVFGAAMALRFKADIQQGDTVLINGATGFTGRVAVQIAKLYGAGKIIVTGRNKFSLNDLTALGADEIISLVQPDEDFKKQLAGMHRHTPVDIVIDYLWGHSAEMIFACIKGDGSVTNKIRYVSVGSVTGDLIQLSAATLRSANIQLTGSGLGSWSAEQLDVLFAEILPAMFQLAADGKLTVQTVTQQLENIATLWERQIPDGKRLVILV